jgi:hypothetical protein
MYHRNVRNLSELSVFKGIEFYILFTYCVDIFEGTITTDQMNVLRSLSVYIGKIMNNVEYTPTSFQLLRSDIFKLVEEAGLYFGQKILTLATHTCTHFTE